MVFQFKWESFQMYIVNHSLNIRWLSHSSSHWSCGQSRPHQTPSINEGTTQFTFSRELSAVPGEDPLVMGYNEGPSFISPSAAIHETVVLGGVTPERLQTWTSLQLEHRIDTDPVHEVDTQSSVYTFLCFLPYRTLSLTKCTVFMFMFWFIFEYWFRDPWEYHRLFW